MDKVELFKQREKNYSRESEKQTKELLAALLGSGEKIESYLETPASQKQSEYIKGYLAVLNEGCSSIKAFLDEDNLRKDYTATFKTMRNNYHQKAIMLFKAENNSFNDGQYEAAVHLDNSFDGYVQRMAMYDHTQLQNHQQQRKSVRR